MPALVNNRAAQGWNIALLDLYARSGLDRSTGSTDYNSDGLHLTLTGYSKLATSGELCSIPPCHPIHHASFDSDRVISHRDISFDGRPVVDGLRRR